MRLQIVSDLHLEFEDRAGFRGARFVLPQTRADAIVVAGDTGYGLRGLEWAADVARAHGKPMLMVFGNHDYWAASKKKRYRIDTLLRWARERSRELRRQGTPLWFLENGEAVIDGVRFLGMTLWTDYDRGNVQTMLACRSDMNDFGQIAGRLQPADLYLRHRDSVAWLKRRLARPKGGKTVVISHHAPSYRSTWRGKRPSWNDIEHAYCSDLEPLIRSHGIDLWIHGHQHMTFDYRIGDTRVVANARGYAPYGVQPAFDPAWICEV